MRLHFTLSANQQAVPFDYQHFLTGAFHKWLAQNELHDRISLYSLGWLDGGRCVNDHLEFLRGARWFISTHDDSLLQTIVDGALIQPEVCCGMRVVEIKQQQPPDFGPRYTFKVGSPVLAKGKPDENGKVHHYIFSDPEADDILTATLRHKMDIAELDEQHKDVTVRFDREYKNPKTKLVTIKGIEHRASFCPVIVEGTPEAVQFAWNVGVGNSTGSGFGSLI